MTYEALELFKQLFLAGGKEPPTTSAYAEHLNGTTRLEAATDGSRFACSRILDGVAPQGTPLLEFHGTDGRFAFMFFKRRTDNGQALLNRVAKYYRLTLEPCKKVALPFFGTELFPLCPDNPENENGFRFLEEALQYIVTKTVDEGDIDAWEKSLPYQDAPFCVQSFFLSNGKLPEFACAYLDSRGAPIKDKKLAEDWKRKTYPMDCDNIGWNCDRTECEKRKYGCTSNEMSQLEFGKLTQYQGGQVFYVWNINNEEVRFDSEVEIMRQERFLPICMRELGVLPRRMSNAYWLKIINKALSNMKVVGHGGASELTTDRVKNILLYDLRKRTLVSTWYEYERLMQGWIYLNPAISALVIDPQGMCAYIRGKYPDLRIDSLADFHTVLRNLGFKKTEKHIDTEKKILRLARSEFLFDDRNKWVEYMLDVSSGTIWEENFRAFLLDEPSGAEPLDEDTASAIDEDAALFLDTEGGL